MSKRNILGMILLSAMLAACSRQTPVPVNSVERMGISVLPEENREYSYTDKRSGYYYGRTHESHFREWFAGWNVAQHRIVSDYDLFVDGVLLSRKEADAIVYPHYLYRRYDVAVERFSLIDGRTILSVGLDSVNGKNVAIALDTALVSVLEMRDGVLWYEPREMPEHRVAVAPQKDVESVFDEGVLQATSDAGGFLLAYGTREECLENISAFRANGRTWLNERQERMDSLIMRSNPIHSNLDSLDKAMAWLLLTTDQLVTRQQGRGIYAGLPWFNEYWGRDMFISMPGATLVSGAFDVTREILTDFSRLQDVNPASPTYGRVPNRANIEGILYNTTDGTPRFVMEVADYVRYTGDTAFIRSIYPAVALSIDASTDLFVDKSGYLCHADADTWMDVVRNGIPGSPRGNRANDIQALWYAQLMDGAYMAQYMGDTARADAWEKRAVALRQNFMRDYCDKATCFIADHLNVDGSRDNQVRPNQLYTFELIDDADFCMNVTRRVWEELVYPWGVGSLSQCDDNFHPQHENWHYYHKDDAYHNGTVWLWNNGIAMQRMIEHGQVETAWQLFKNMCRQALAEGAVGSLSENADAHPRDGAAWADRSGTFLQAWSNAEQLRVWYQYFLGIRPDMVRHVVTVNPQLPSDITSLTWSERIGKGALIGSYERTDEETVYAYVLRDEYATLQLSIPLYASVDVALRAGDVLIAHDKGGILTLEVTDSDGSKRTTQEYRQDENLILLRDEQNEFFEGCNFCQPVHRDDLKALSVYHEKALTY